MTTWVARTILITQVALLRVGATWQREKRGAFDQPSPDNAC